MRDSVQPAGQRVERRQCGRLFRQDRESSLEGVLCVVLVAGHVAADAEYEPAGPPDERGERVGVAARRPCAEDLAVRSVGVSACEGRCF